MHTHNVTLAGGEKTTLTFAHDTGNVDPGKYEVGVHSEDDSVVKKVKLIPKKELSVSITEMNAPVGAGETLEVTAEVTNTGDKVSNQTIALDIGDQEAADTATVGLESGENTMVTLDYETHMDDAGEHTMVVRSANYSDTRTVTIKQPTINTGGGSDETPTGEESVDEDTPSEPTDTSTPTEDGPEGENQTQTPTSHEGGISDDSSTETPDNSPTEAHDTVTVDSTSGNGAGFGVAVALIALLSAALFTAYRRV